MKITQLFKIYWPDNGGGIAKVMEGICEGFPDCEQEIIVCQDSRKKKSADGQYKGISVLRCRPSFAVASTPVSLRYLHDVKKHTKDSDIVIYHFPYPMVDLAVLLGMYSGKLVVWWHCGFEKYERLAPLYRPLAMHTLKKADQILVSARENIANSDVLRRFKKKCRVIPFCVSDECLERGRAYVNGMRKEEGQKEEGQIRIVHGTRKEEGQKEEGQIRIVHGTRKEEGQKEERQIRILFVGRLVWYKGCDVLLKAFAKMRRDCKLTLVGDGPMAAELKGLAASLGLKNVEFTGMVPEEEKMQKIAECDFLVLPSVSKAEAFAVVQLEAMAFGKPVINTALQSGVPSVSLDRVTGRTVRPGSVRELAAAMEELAGNAKLRKAYGENALERVQKRYTQKKMVERHREVFQRLLHESWVMEAES